MSEKKNGMTASQLMKGSSLKGPITLEWRSDGLMAIELDGRATPVKASRCFPWTEPARYITLRDEKEAEVGLVETPDSLDDKSREALECALIEADFVLNIEKIDTVEDEFEIRRWHVQTSQGPRQFQTRRDDWPREAPGGGFLIRDVAGDLYRVADPDALDPKSQALLWAFTD